MLRGLLVAEGKGGMEEWIIEMRTRVEWVEDCRERIIGCVCVYVWS